MARVTVEGFMNEVPFVVSRSKSASRGDLFFQLDGIDMTTQSVKETQALLEEKLGVDPDILSRSIFHGQHDVNDLLEATDAKLKDELSLVVPVDLWQSASAVARAKTRDAKKRFDELEGMRRLRATDIANLRRKVDEAKATRELKYLRFKETKMELDRLLEELDRIPLEHEDSRSSVDIQNQLDTLDIRTLTSLLETKLKDRDNELLPLRRKLEEATITRDATRQKYAEQNMRVARSDLAVTTAENEVKKLERKWSMDLSVGVPAKFVPPEICPTCSQPLLFQGSSHDHSSIEDTIRNEVEMALQNLNSAEAELNEARIIAAQILDSLQKHDFAIENLRAEIADREMQWDDVTKRLQVDIQKKRDLQAELTSQLSSLVQKSQLSARKEAATATCNMEQLAWQHASEVLEGLEIELRNATDLQKQIELEKEELETSRRLLSDVAERCGQRGVQAFILQNVVDSLEMATQRYLDYLSEGGQKLELSLEAGEKISRLAYVRGSDGDFKQRPLSTLSGGQWRRCSLALSFAFAELVARRGRLKSSLLVLDEPLTHLDRSGRTKFGEVVRRLIKGASMEDEWLCSGLQFSTVILILQDLSAEELEEAFDRMDTVVRENGGSYVQVDEGEFS